MAADPKWLSIQDGCQSERVNNLRWLQIQNGHQPRNVILPQITKKDDDDAEDSNDDG